ncbi:hypothetical protein [Streptomyces sp. ADMS]
MSSTPGVIPVRDSRTAPHPPHNGPVLLFQAGPGQASSPT